MNNITIVHVTLKGSNILRGCFVSNQHSDAKLLVYIAQARELNQGILGTSSFGPPGRASQKQVGHVKSILLLEKTLHMKDGEHMEKVF